MINICYVDFWVGFDVNKNWFSSFFRDYFKGETVNFNSSEEKADIIFGSCFGYSIRNCTNTKAKKIFFTGENIRPNLGDYDYSLSFDIDNYNGKNLRLPLWMVYIDWWNSNPEDISLIELNTKYNAEEVYNRKKFCSIMIGNPVRNRINVAEILNTYNEVDKFGSVYNNRYEGKKLDLLKKYRYNICFENSIYHGYHTEKVVQAKLSGCIPIYYGDNTLHLDFNEKSIINYYNFSNEKDILDYIVDIDTNKNKFIDIVSQPLFNESPNIKFLYEFFERILK